MGVEYRDVRLLETKVVADTPGAFSGYGAAFENEDTKGDVIQRGAFAATLREWRARGKFPPMLLQHGGVPFGAVTVDSLLPIGRWTAMHEDSQGLRVEGQLIALETERGQYVYHGLKSGALDGLSIGYEERAAHPAERRGSPVRILTDVGLVEVSIVTFPSNPRALVTAVKSLTIETLREIEEHLYQNLREVGYSHRDVKRVVAAIRKDLQRDAGEPEREQRDAAADGEVEGLLGALRGRTASRLAGALQTHISTHAAGGVRR